MQIKHQFQKLISIIQTSTDQSKISVDIIVGGMSRDRQERALKKKPSILVATPGRLWELIQSREIYLQQIELTLSFLVLDEADRMLDQNHFPDLKQLINLFHYKNHTKNGTN